MQKTALSINDMIQFSQLMLRFQEIKRVIFLPNRDTPENDVEHSYQLAMMAWYLNSSAELGLDTDRLLRYTLVHDLAEIYAGDIPSFDTQGRKHKVELEHQALKQIRAEMPATHELIDTIEEYELQDNDESNFVYALDKLMPMLTVYIEGGKSWQEYDLAFEPLHADKLDKVARSEPVRELYKQLTVLLMQNPHMFAGRQ